MACNQVCRNCSIKLTQGCGIGCSLLQPGESRLQINNLGELEVCSNVGGLCECTTVANNSLQLSGMDLFGFTCGLPGLIGYWPMSAINITGGQLPDFSLQGNALQNQGICQIGRENSISYVEFDNSLDYAYKTNNASLNLTGSNIYIQNNGITMGCLVYFENDLTKEYIFGKTDVGVSNTNYYRLLRESNGKLQFGIGSGIVETVTATIVAPSNIWIPVIGRWIPNVSMSIYYIINNSLGAVSIPSNLVTIATTTYPLLFGRGYFTSSTERHIGRQSNNFITQSALDNTTIDLWLKLAAKAVGVL